MLNQRTQLDHLFQALADPTRRGIVEQLSRGPASVSKLAEPFAMSLPAVLQHLQVLEASGLVRSEKAGRVRPAASNERRYGRRRTGSSRGRASWERRLDRLGTFLAAQDEPSTQRRKS